MAGTILIAAAEVTRLGLLMWESGILDLSTPADIEGFQRVGVIAATAAEHGSFMGVGALAWGLRRESNRPAAPLTAVRLALIAGAAILGAIDVGLLIAEWSPLALAPWVQSAGWIYFALPALTSLVWVLAAVVTIRAARSGPPLDWRWPVGIGVTIHLVAEAVLSLASLASTGTSAAAVAPWFIWIRLASACGIGLVIAGLAGAAFIRYPGVVVSDS